MRKWLEKVILGEINSKEDMKNICNAIEKKVLTPNKKLSFVLKIKKERVI